MGKNYGNYLVAAAVFSLVVTLTSAAGALGDSCSADTECTVTGATCISSVCACSGSYKVDTGDNTKCKLKGLTDVCSAASDCTGVTGATCISNACACGGSYKVDPVDNTKCIQRGLTDTCSVVSDCEPVTGATCTSNSCACGGSYKADPDDATKCKQRGLNDTCAGIDDCIWVSNAECPSTTLKCTCKITYKEENGKCNTANGLQTLLSAPVALLLSFLTIVVTRLH